jgi:prophage regulatory protein
MPKPRKAVATPIKTPEPAPVQKQVAPEPIDDFEQEGFLSKKQLLKRIPVSFPTIWKWMMAGEFPRAREIGPRKSGWLESEVSAWIASRPIRQLKSDKQAEA